MNARRTRQTPRIPKGKPQMAIAGLDVTELIELALMHHLLSGLRHLVWDLGYGFKANEREALTWGALIGGISLTVLVWIIAYSGVGR